MNKIALLAIILAIHTIGAIIAMIIHHKNKTFEYASKHGDGIRFAKPSDIIFLDCFVWEILLLLFIMDSIETKMNNNFCKKCKH